MTCAQEPTYTDETLLDEDAPNPVNSLNAGNPPKNALFARFCALLDSASFEVFDSALP